MAFDFFLKGLALGFAIAAPVGPIGLLCISRTLDKGRVSGLVSGVGAATADALYGAVAGFGLSAVSSFLVGRQFILGLIGGHVLLILGVKTFKRRPTQTETRNPSRLGGLAGDYASTFFLTLTNPMTILAFAAIFAGLGLPADGSYGSAATLVTGIFLGSSAWWLLLSGGVGLIRRRFTPRLLVWVNRVAGVILFGFGVVMLLRLVI